MTMPKRRIAFLVMFFCIVPAGRASNNEAVAPVPMDEFDPTPSIITSPGYYKLSSDLIGTVTISSNCVTLDLNSFCISNGTTHGVLINNNASQVTIRNGTIISPASGNGVEIEGGCADITIENIRVVQCAVGLNAASCSDILVRDSSFLNNTNEGIKLSSCFSCLLNRCRTASNATGVLLEQSDRNNLQGCLAIEDAVAGYSLLSSADNFLVDCTSLNIGSSGSAIDTYGFVADGGSCNTFDCCCARGVVTSATDVANIAAGFALKGGETCSAITRNSIGCTQTPSGGSSAAYGILLEASVSPFTRLVSGNVAQTMYTCQWHPKTCDYFVLGGVPSNGQIRTYFYDRDANTITDIQTLSHGATGEIRNLEWSLDGDYLAAVGSAGSGGYDTRVYSLDSCGNILEVATEATHGATLYATSWSPSGGHLVVGGVASGGNQIRLYSFNKNATTLTSVSTIAHGATVWTIKWSPSGRFLAVGSETTGGNQLFIYEFDPITETLALRDSQAPGATVYSAAWSCDDRYLAMGGAAGTGGNDTRLYSFDSSTKVLTLQDSLVHGATVYGVDWSPCRRYFVTAGVNVAPNEEAVLYTFDLETETFSVQAVSDTGPSPCRATSWGKDGGYILICGAEGVETLTHDIYSGALFVTKNLVADNDVYCTTGNNLGTSVGIFGSNCFNLIKNNMAYGNNKDYSFVTNIVEKCSRCTCFDEQTTQGGGCDWCVVSG